MKNFAAPIGCGLIFLILLNHIFFLGFVPSNSMEPTIREGSFIIGIRTFAEPERDDIVVFEHESRLLVKRITGVFGDVVSVDGENRIVPEGDYFMLGDNTEHSIDSRYWDEPFVSREQIIAVLLKK
jgi:signal peptidase I